MGKGSLPFSVGLAFKLISNFESKGCWDRLFATGKAVRNLGPNLELVYSSLKPVWPTSARDFCAVSRARLKKDGSIWLGIVSASPQLEVPHVAGRTRGNLIFGGWILEPGDDDGTCKATYIVLVDPNGSIPKAIVNKVSWGLGFNCGSSLPAQQLLI